MEYANHYKKTTHVKVGTAINALNLSRDNSRVVVAGRSLLKIFSIGDDGAFGEPLNLHFGRKQGLNMSSADVTWSQTDDNKIATAATNGAIVAWDLLATGRNRQLVVFQEHKRAVTKVHFHPSEAHLIISGSQDTTMKMFDLRKKECVTTFNSKADGVRSVQFSPHSYYQYAASFDNGNVQVWDYRNANMYTVQYLAHKGSVYALDWHPEKENTLATGGRDGMVKIWEMANNRAKEVGNIPTTSSVSCVKWRPDRRDQLATVSMMLDFSINVWDLRRKFVPFAYFNEHNNVTTGIVWRKNDCDDLFSCSKDGTLYKHTTRDAVRPADNTINTALAFSHLGYICHVTEKSASTFEAQSPTGSTTGIYQGGKLGGIFRKQSSQQSGSEFELSYSGPSSPTLQMGFKMKKFLNCESRMTIFDFTQSLKIVPCVDLDDERTPRDTLNEHLYMSGFRLMAREYKLNGRERNLSFSELCQHNCAISLKAGNNNVARIWLLLDVFYSKDVQSLEDTNFEPASEKHKRNDSGGSKRTSIIPRKDEVLSDFVGGGDTDLEMKSDEERKKEMEEYLTDIAKGRHSEPDFYSDEDRIPEFGDDGITSDADITSDHDWQITLQSEAFNQREYLTEGALSGFGRIEAPSEMTHDVGEQAVNYVPHGGRWQQASALPRHSNSPLSPPPSGVDGNTSEVFDFAKTFVVKPSLWPSPLDTIKDEITRKQISFFAELGDVQSSVCILLALWCYGIPIHFSPTDASVEQWQFSYLDLLAKHKLWVQHAEVVKYSRTVSIQMLSASSVVHSSCGTCQRRMPANHPWSCDRRYTDPAHNQRGVTCFFCHLPVKELYTYCQGCAFGGHFRCVEKWMKRKPRANRCSEHCC